jgi:hypothetical protein
MLVGAAVVRWLGVGLPESQGMALPLISVPHYSTWATVGIAIFLVVLAILLLLYTSPEYGGMSRAEGKCTSGAEQNCTTERHSMSMKVSWSVEAWARSVS